MIPTSSRASVRDSAKPAQLGLLTGYTLILPGRAEQHPFAFRKHSSHPLSCTSTTVRAWQGARKPSFNIHFVSGATQGAALVPKTVGGRAVQSLRDKGQQGQGMSAAGEAVWVVCKGMKAGTGSGERLVGTSLQTEWDALAQSCA